MAVNVVIHLLTLEVIISVKILLDGQEGMITSSQNTSVTVSKILQLYCHITTDPFNTSSVVHSSLLLVVSLYKESVLPLQLNNMAT